MSWMKSFAAALQVVKSMPVRTLLLALPVAAATALGLAALVIEHGVTSKARAATESWGLDQVVVHGKGAVQAGKVTGDPTLTEKDLEELKTLLATPYVKAVLPTKRNNDTPVSVPSTGKNAVYKVYAVTPGWDDARHFPAQVGRFVNDEDYQTGDRVCILGQQVVRDLFNKDNPLDEKVLGQEIMLNTQPFKVKGILEFRGSSPAEGNRDARIMVTITALDKHLKYKRTYDQIVIQTKNTDDATINEVRQRVMAMMRKQHNIAAGEPEDFTVRYPAQMTEASRELSRSVFYMLLGIAAVCILVAAGVIALVFHQTISTRRSEIGIRRALGAEPGDIVRQIWLEGLLVSLLGGILGLIIGLPAAWAVTYRGDWPFLLNAPILALPLVVVALTSLAGLMAARSAARLDPAEALRPAA